MSNCIYVDYGDSVDFSDAQLVKARKPHRCGECGEMIATGNLYERTKSVYDGSWYTHQTCARCVNIRTDYFGAWIQGGMVEDFKDAHGFDYRDGIPADFAPCREAHP